MSIQNLQSITREVIEEFRCHGYEFRAEYSWDNDGEIVSIKLVFVGRLE